MMNCLEYALLFWEKHPEYKIYYNSDHCVNAYEPISGSGYLPAESFGYCYFSGSFEGLLSEHARALLRKYFSEAEEAGEA